MTSPSFIAFVHDVGGESVVEKIAEFHKPPHIRRFDLAEGRLTLCQWSEANGRTDGEGTVLVDVNMARSTSPTPIPAKIVNADMVPKGLLAQVNQFHSYLYLDDRKRAVFWTDHVGFSKIFHLATNGCQVFSDDLSAFRPLGLAIDQGMVASYLVNGSMVADRTLYEGVRNLTASHVVVATPRELQEQRYWRFEPSRDAGADGIDVAQDLWTRTEAAVLRHAGEHQVIVPLSGGYDSSCILAVLAAAKREISTFTYVNGPPQPGSDADVARRQAEVAGVEHRIIGIEDESFLGMLKANVNAGLYMRNANYEIASYASAVDSVKGRFPNPIMLFGEECFGGPSYRLNSNNDLLGSIILKSPERLAELEPVLGQSAIVRLRDEMQRSHDSLFDSSLQGQNQKDKSDLLYFRVRMGLNMIPLLVYTAGCFAPVATPFLDIDLLDGMRYVSGAQRVEKRLFVGIVQEKFPEMFRIPRSRFDQTEPDLGVMIKAEEAAIRAYLGDLTVGVPGILTPADLQALLTLVLTPKPASQAAGSPVRTVITALRSVAKSMQTSGVIPSWIRTQVRQRTLNNFSWGPDPMTLFQRALQLAMTFERLHTGEALR
jgi:hypothetical protein